MTLKKFIDEYYFPYVKREFNNSGTQSSYWYYLGKISSILLREDIENITADQINAFREYMIARYPLISVVRRTLHILDRCFNYAVMSGCLQHNPCDGILMPPGKDVIRYYGEPERKILLDTIPYYPLTDLYGTAVCSVIPGKRLLGIRLQDIDVEKMTVEVHFEVRLKPKTRIVTKLEKPAKYTVSESAMHYIRHAHDWQTGKRCRDGNIWNPDGWLFTNFDGSEISKLSVRMASVMLREATGLHDVSLRKIYRSNLKRKEHQ